MVDLTKFGAVDERDFLEGERRMDKDPRDSPIWADTRSARISVPLVNSRSMRYHAERFRVLANRLDDLSREPLPAGMNHDEHEARLMREAAWVVRECHRAINAPPDEKNVLRLKR